MIKYGIPEFIGNLLKPVMNKLFKIKSSTAFILVMSIISGNPSNAKYTRELYLNNDINIYEATKILCFSCFVSPMFILGTVSILFLNNHKVGFFILFCHYIGNIIIGLLLRNYHPSPKEKTKVSLGKALKSMYEKRISNKESFGQILTNSLINSINTLLLILGVISICLVFTTIIDNNINLSSVLQSILNGSIEITQGLKYISLEALPLKIKCVLSVMILSFGGLSIHLQIMGILSDTNIKYMPFLLSRLIHCLISGFLTFILFDLYFN
ncbi:MAG: hypothetical protein IJ093_04005 [Bacilli bacterium]|nr:hypothetical protein [Bacilli bacterium]